MDNEKARPSCLDSVLEILDNHDGENADVGAQKAQAVATAMIADALWTILPDLLMEISDRHAAQSDQAAKYLSGIHVCVSTLHQRVRQLTETVEKAANDDRKSNGKQKWVHPNNRR